MQTGVLYRDDNLERLASMPSESVDLIYLDPPFFSNRSYEVIWGDEAEVRSFDDRWEGGIQHYIDWMRERLAELHRVLRKTGSLYLHCDPHASHHLKLMIDGVFGASSFRNEIIWKRSAVKGDARRKFGSNHDSIFFYSKSSKYRFEPQYTEKTKAYFARFNYDDGDGRGLYRLAPLDSPSYRPNLIYPYKGFDPPKKGWRVSLPVMERLDREGRLAFPAKPGGRIARKHYLGEQKGPKVTDVWSDFGPLQAANIEKLGYPTQKPEALLSRIINASSGPDEVVLDPFCGCGTTIAAASKLGRQWIGIDISPTAIEIMRRRLLKFGVNPIIENAVETLIDLKALRPFEFQNWVINAMNGAHSPKKVGDMGIDGFSFLTRDPIQVKQSEHVGRPTVDSFQTAMRRNNSDAGYIVGFSFTRDAFEEVARVKKEGLAINLVKVAELLLLAKRPGSRIASVGPQPATVSDLPLLPKRKPEDLPTAAELIASVRQTATA